MLEQRKGLDIWTNNLLSAIQRYSDTSHMHEALHSSYPPALQRKCISPVSVDHLRSHPKQTEHKIFDSRTNATNISCSLLSAYSNLTKYCLCEQIDSTHVACSSKFKLPENKHCTEKLCKLQS